MWRQWQVLHKKYSWQVRTSWINTNSSLADISAAVTLVPSSWKATVFKLTCIQILVSQWMYSPALCTGQLCSGHEHFAGTGFPLHVLLFWKMNMLIASCSEVGAVLKCSRSIWCYFWGGNPVLPASASVKSASWSSSGTLPSPLRRALQPWGGHSASVPGAEHTSAVSRDCPEMLTGVKWFWLGKSACLALKGHQTFLNKEVLASLFPLTVLILQMKTDYLNPIYTL